MAQKQHAIILWLDELGLRSQHTAGKSFAPKGKTPVLTKSGNRFYLHQISAISNQGILFLWWWMAILMEWCFYAF
jgi:hypothetical protein